jgi:hypothetical protein
MGKEDGGNRSLVYEAIHNASSWIYEDDLVDDWPDVRAEVALHKLCLIVSDAIDADPVLKDVFDKTHERQWNAEPPR